MLLKAIKAVPYGGKRYQPGQKFEAADRHGRLLVALNKAEVAEPDAVAEPDDKQEAKPKRVYQRRDMKAAD